jgi:hypothetical protein
MALQLNFTICQGECDELIFTDTTGLYEATENPGGYGDVNPVTGDFTNPTLTLEDLSGGITTINLPAGFPTSNTAFYYTHTLAGDLVDGVYIVTYTITDSSGGSEVDYSKSCYKLFTCQADCCIQKLYAKVSTDDCATCNDSVLSKAVEAEAFLKGAKANALCGEITMATSLLKKVQYMCTASNCKCS